MSSLRELKKRLKSAETIQKLSGAMRTAATAKYMKASSRLAAYSAYSGALADIGGAEPDGEGGETVYVLVSGNHGLCGGYHHELFAFFLRTAKDGEIITCGKRAREFCRERKLPVIGDIPVSDIPTFREAKELAELLGSLGKRAVVVYQRFVNMLKQTPCAEALASRAGGTAKEDGEDGRLFVPDAETVWDELGALTLASDIYEKLLSAASGAQAATVIAMRSAFDNAGNSIQELETRINRLRQAAVTAGVLETSAEIYE